jgi:hypothetical protein
MRNASLVIRPVLATSLLPELSLYHASSQDVEPLTSYSGTSVSMASNKPVSHS